MHSLVLVVLSAEGCGSGVQIIRLLSHKEIVVSKEATTQFGRWSIETAYIPILAAVCTGTRSAAAAVAL
jgi:hypothetical protein